VGLLAKRRFTAWVEGLKQWAMDETRLRGPQSREGAYALGVLMGASDAQAPSQQFATAEQRMQLSRHSRETEKGYADTLALIREASAAGSPPRGDYRELLGSPSSESLAG
jgi:hypothetical protein